MNHSCENTSLQNVLVENLQVPAIVWTDTVGSHTFDVKEGRLFLGITLQLHQRDTAQTACIYCCTYKILLKQVVFTVGHMSMPLNSEDVLNCCSELTTVVRTCHLQVSWKA